MAELARLGTLAPVTDVERVGRLLAHLAAGVRAGRGSGGPPVLLVVDGWEQALDAWYPVEHGRLVDDLLRLARDGAGGGVHLAVTGGRAVLAGPLAGLLTEHWLLRAADPADLVMAGVPASALPGAMPTGRVLRLVPGGVEEAQVALPGPTAEPDDPHAGPWPHPLRLRALPDRLALPELLDAGAAPAVAGGCLPVGLGGDEATADGPPATGPGWSAVRAPGGRARWPSRGGSCSRRGVRSSGGRPPGPRWPP